MNNRVRAYEKEAQLQPQQLKATTTQPNCQKTFKSLCGGHVSCYCCFFFSPPFIYSNVVVFILDVNYQPCVPCYNNYWPYNYAALYCCIQLVIPCRSFISDRQKYFCCSISLCSMSYDEHKIGVAFKSTFFFCFYSFSL